MSIICYGKNGFLYVFLFFHASYSRLMLRRYKSPCVNDDYLTYHTTYCWERRIQGWIFVIVVVINVGFWMRFFYIWNKTWKLQFNFGSLYLPCSRSQFQSILCANIWVSHLVKLVWRVSQSVRVQDNMSHSSIVFMSSVYVQITGDNIFVYRVDKEVTALLSG